MPLARLQPRPWLMWPEWWLMVAEWLLLDVRRIWQFVSRIISFRFELEPWRGVWDTLEVSTWTLLGSEWEHYC